MKMTQLIVVLAVAFSPLLAQQDGLPTPPATPPALEAYRAEEPPVIDGNVLDDPAWAVAVPATSFWQTKPNAGQPASERTEVRVLFDNSNLYFGVICYDRDPAGIIVSDSRRDASLEETDSFQIIIDTYLDRRNGFVFGTNPAGIEYDGQVTREGEGGGFGSRQSGGAGGGFNINWDGAWEVRTSVTATGWSAEFVIPFSTLRYRQLEVQTWGVNFQRNIRRRNESSFWSPLPQQFNLHRLSLAGTLTGVEIDYRRNFRVTPYLLGEIRDRTEKTNWVGDTGVDLKYNLTSSLTLDGTYNTDFAQVEVDEQQVNLDRFNLFFPEKRPFFLENAGFFAVGDPGEVEMFFSRRIGIGAGGSVIPIVGGARLSGKVGNRVNLGLLNMQTQAVDGVAPANNFTVARFSHEFGNRSALGGIFVNRQASGEGAGPDDYNRTFAVDGRWGIGEFTEVSGFLAGTGTPGLSDRQHAYNVGVRYDSPTLLLDNSFMEVAENFNPEVGFLMRTSFRKIDSLTMHRIRPESFIGIQELRPHVSYRGYWDFDGFHETGRLHMDNHWEWKSGAEVHTGMNVTREGVKEAFQIAPGVVVPPGTYDHQEAQLVAFTNEGAWISFRLDSTIGGFFGGDRIRLEPSTRLRVGEAFNAEISLDRNDISLPWGDFVTNLARARVAYSFTPRVFVQSLVQYNDLSRLWSTNLRFAWLQAANTGLFVVFNHTRDTRAFALDRFPGERSLIIKYSHMLDLFH